MGYDVSIGVCTDAKNAVVKSHDGSVYIGTCTLIQPCDILHPTLKIAGAITGGNMFDLLGRNYYITQSVINNGATYISGTVDALSSWSDSILGTTQHVTRCETDYNPMLNDNMPVLARPNCKIYTIGDPVFGNSLGTDACYLVGIK